MRIWEVWNEDGGFMVSDHYTEAEAAEAAEAASMACDEVISVTSRGATEDELLEAQAAHEVREGLGGPGVHADTSDQRGGYLERAAARHRARPRPRYAHQEWLQEAHGLGCPCSWCALATATARAAARLTGEDREE